MAEDQKHKSHRAKRAGCKFEHKKRLKQENNVQSKNEKANDGPAEKTLKTVLKSRKQQQRERDKVMMIKGTKKASKTEANQPPIIVAVVGPSQVGKSTVIRNLVRHYTAKTVKNPRGLVTVVSGKTKRLAFFECPNNINAMIDMAKIADLVLLVIDAKTGFEMETFEFINIAQTHGFAKTIGVVTHMDLIKTQKQAKKTRMAMKKRFWKELHTGAKLFCFSSQRFGRYPKIEVRNLARFISVAKIPKLLWRTNHAYLVADRFEDITDPQTKIDRPLSDRTLSFFGFVRGSDLGLTDRLHLVGVGDFEIDSCKTVMDPCPPADKTKRRIAEFEKKVYAPLTNLGDIICDEDAVYIDLNEKNINFTQPDSKNVLSIEKKEEIVKELSKQGEGRDIMKTLQNTDNIIGQKREQTAFHVFPNSNPITKTQINKFLSKTTNLEPKEIKTENEIYNSIVSKNVIGKDGVLTRKVFFKKELENDSDNGISSEKVSKTNEKNSGKNKIKNNMSDQEKIEEIENKTENRRNKIKNRENMAKIINTQTKVDYQGINTERKKIIFEKKNEKSDKFCHNETDSSDNSDYRQNEKFRMEGFNGVLNRVKARSKTLSAKIYSMGSETDSEGEKSRLCSSTQSEFKDDEYLAEIAPQLKSRFVARKRRRSEPKNSEQSDSNSEENSEYEKPQKSDENNSEDENEKEKDTEKFSKKSIKEKKLVKKAEFERIYSGAIEPVAEKVPSSIDDPQNVLKNNAISKMSEIEKAVFRGFPTGSYVRVVLKGIPCEFPKRFDQSFPVVLGALRAREGAGQLKFLRASVKKHRWHKRVLKNGDPVVFSVGWRRFQSLPIFSREDENGRQRMVKYTPENEHCNATFWAPSVPQGTGVLGYTQLEVGKNEFQVAITGTVRAVNSEFKIMKKIKLVGEAKKIERNTAFIKGMFNTPAEAAKFEGAFIRTVSGIRGAIKKAVTNDAPGTFRATFEDKILYSDIVFLRCWTPVPLPQFFNPLSFLIYSKTPGINRFSSNPRQNEQESSKIPLNGEKSDKTFIEAEGYNSGLMRLTREIRQERGTKAVFKADSVYTSFDREPRAFKPFHVPERLQKLLPFKSKPKFRAQRARLMEQQRPIIEDKNTKTVRSLIKELNAIKKESQSKENWKRTERQLRLEKEQQELEKTTRIRDRERRGRRYTIKAMREKANSGKKKR